MSRMSEIHRARRLRQSANLPEQKAWQALRQLRKYGYPVRRQHPIGGYIVDFAIIKARLIIEIDGSIHTREDVQLRDAERQAYLEKLGWRVLRIEAEAALSADELIARLTQVLGL